MAAAIDNSVENKQLVEKVASLIWDGRFSDIDEHLTDDFRGHDPMVDKEMRNGADMAASFGPMQDAMSDIEYEIIDIVAEDNLVFHRGRLSAVHTGEFMGMEPTDERMVVEDHIGWRLEDGQIAESWAQYDAIGMMRQMGMEMPGME